VCFAQHSEQARSGRRQDSQCNWVIGKSSRLLLQSSISTTAHDAEVVSACDRQPSHASTSHAQRKGLSLKAISGTYLEALNKITVLILSAQGCEVVVAEGLLRMLTRPSCIQCFQAFVK
jgi:hypothetical protein